MMGEKVGELKDLLWGEWDVPRRLSGGNLNFKHYTLYFPMRAIPREEEFWERDRW